MSTMAKERARSWWIPWAFVGFFVVILAVNGVLVIFAFDSWTGLETQDAYQKGLAYNEQIAEAEAQAKLGWHGSLSFEPTAARAGRVTLVLADRFGTPVTGAAVRAELVRPIHEGEDFAALLDDRGGGKYEAELSFPLAGQWDLRLVADHERGLYRLRERIVVK